MSDLFLLAGSALCGWLFVTVLVPPLARLCHRFGFLDQPTPRRIHRVPTPRLTGIALFAAVWATILLAGLLVPARMKELGSHAVPIIIGAVATLLVGIADDLRPLRGSVKLGAQALIGLFLWFSGIGFGQLWIPFVGGIELGVWSLPVTMAWFLVLVNAVNIIDGVDGLATATAGIATLPLIWISMGLQLSPVWIASASLFGGLAGFWRFNHYPARVFMGDSGSLSLGYFFAVVALLAPIKRFTALAFFVPLIAMFLPLAESVISLGRRSMAGNNPMVADTGHLHHRLIARGWTANRVVASYSIVTAVFGGFCVAFRYANRRLLTVILGFFVLSLLVSLGIIFRRKLPARADGTGAKQGSGG